MGRQTGWIFFSYRRKSKSGLTSIWRVQDRDAHVLGEIRWYAPWRRYALYPEPETVWEQDCLRVAADFCQVQTKKHRSKS
jgi:hypothetical protein